MSRITFKKYKKRFQFWKSNSKALLLTSRLHTIFIFSSCSKIHDYYLPSLRESRLSSLVVNDVHCWLVGAMVWMWTVPPQAPVSPGQSPVTSAFLVGCKIVRQWRFSGGSLSPREGLQVYIPDPLCSMVIRHVNKPPHTCSPTVTSNCHTHHTHIDCTVKSVSLDNLSGHPVSLLVRYLMTIIRKLMPATLLHRLWFTNYVKKWSSLVENVYQLLHFASLSTWEPKLTRKFLKPSFA